MAKNNKGKLEKMVTTINGYKVLASVNFKAISKVVMTLTLSISLAACSVVNDISSEKEIESLKDDNKTRVEEEQKNEVNIDQNIEIMDGYVRYVENADVPVQSESLDDTKDLIEKEYEKRKEAIENSNVKEKIQEAKYEFVYSMRELIKISDQELHDSGFISYDEYEKNYFQNNKFLASDETNKAFSRVESAFDFANKTFPGKVKKWLYNDERGKDFATEDSIYMQFEAFKEEYLIKRSSPYIEEEELQKLEALYMERLNLFIGKLNEIIGKYNPRFCIPTGYISSEEEYVVELDGGKTIVFQSKKHN